MYLAIFLAGVLVGFALVTPNVSIYDRTERD